MPELAYLNGAFLPIDKAMVPIEDRGYQFGDAVYEYIASYEGRLFCVDEHMARLQRSLGELRFPEIDQAEIRTALHELFQRSQFERAGIYIQISRGVAPRLHEYTDDMQLQVVMTIRALNEVAPGYLETGVGAITVEDLRWGRCDIKCVQLLPNALCKRQALDAGVKDAIFVADDGSVREGTSSNLFMVANGVLKTHPLTRNILPGITRGVLIDFCRQSGIAVEESFFDRQALYAADEVMLTGTTTEVLPLIEIDRHPIGDGKVGPMARKLFAALRQRMAAG
jgi:D-alanine transaminase